MTEQHSGRWFRRFGRFDRVLHLLLMTSFLGLAFTGLPLLFSDSVLARVIAGLFDDYRIAGALHRLFAFVMIGVFLAHLGRILFRLLRRGEIRLVWGADSLVPQPRDLFQMLAHFRYFFGRGPRPRFDRFTYWEKFDYWAVFWGMAVIGGSGLLLWFPVFFSRLVPGWAFNVALLIHGEEALLAVVFIFTVHFFNGHLRPEKFPMDTVIFTGRLPLEELRHERPALADRLEAQSRLEENEVPPPDRNRIVYAKTVGTMAVLLGLLMVLLIAQALLTQ